MATSSVGNTVVLAIAGHASNTGVTATLALVGGTVSTAVGNSVLFQIFAKTSISTIGPSVIFNLNFSDASPDSTKTTVLLSNTWKFQTDPANVGTGAGWYQPAFDDSTWGSLLSDKSWESQSPGHYAGWAWYRQTVSLVIPQANNWLALELAQIQGDHVCYWNGVPIGAKSGQYKYHNQYLCKYYIPPNAALATNTIAIKCWGGNLNTVVNSGLIIGAYSISTADSDNPLWVRPTGGTISQEIPAGAYDLSSAQQGQTFELVIRLDPILIEGLTTPYLNWFLINQYTVNALNSSGISTQGKGITPITLGADGKLRAVISVTPTIATRIYLSGNISVNWDIFDLIPSPWTDTGQQIFMAAPGDTAPTIMGIWSQTFTAGTVALPPDGALNFHAMYIPIIADANVVITNLVVNDNLMVGGIPDSSYWAIKNNLQVGNLVNGDRTIVFQNIPSFMLGGKFLQTSQNSKFFGGNPPATGPMATFTVDRTTTVYLAIDVRVNPYTPWKDAGQSYVVQLPPIGPGGGIISNTDEIYARSFPAGIVALPSINTSHSMYKIFITDPTVVVSNLNVFDTTNAAGWSVQNNLQAGDVVWSDRPYEFVTIPTFFQGCQWIQTPNDSRFYIDSPLIATFTINKPAMLWMALDTRVPNIPGTVNSAITQALFTSRDNTILPALPITFENTPLGNLRLIDRINCGTSLSTETHPYMEGGFLTNASLYETPGSPSLVNTQTILGNPARVVDYGFYAYRIGAGGLTVGKQYVLAATYPEDIPRMQQIEIQAGQGYLDVGWKNGLAGNIYDPWPLSNTWRTFYQIFGLDAQTTNATGAEGGDARNGVWVYIMSKVNFPDGYWSFYGGGAAIGQLSLYEIDPVANAPVITYPDPLPRRILDFDWERPALQPPDDLCRYAKLMGYTAISPIAGMKWGSANFGQPLAGYTISMIDPQRYPTFGGYTRHSGITPVSPFPSIPPIHEQFMAATVAAGIDYIPRFEYGGSYDLPQAAWAIAANGTFAKPNRYSSLSPPAGANLLHPAVFAEMQTFLENFVHQYVNAFPNYKGVLWRIRRDTMQISYGAADIAMFTADTGNTPPNGLTAAGLGNWASTDPIQPLYSTWWQQKRADFHYAIVNLLKSYRPDLFMLYYNWDLDKFGLGEYDINRAAVYTAVVANGGAATYNADLALRQTFTAADYVNELRDGANLQLCLGTAVRPEQKWPDYAIRPFLYTQPGIQIYGPVAYNCYALPDYINYFKTADGVAISHAVSYDEIGGRWPNPKYEGTMNIPGGGSFSMAIEVQAWAYGDARTLNYTTYTYGRGFADYHRAFAQAYLALPAIPSTLVAGTPTHITARTYPNGDSTYIGIANTGVTGGPVTVSIPGTWDASNHVLTDIVAGTQSNLAVSGGSLQIPLSLAPMTLKALLVEPGTPTVIGPNAGIGDPTTLVVIGGFSINVPLSSGIKPVLPGQKLFGDVGLWVNGVKGYQYQLTRDGTVFQSGNWGIQPLYTVQESDVGSVIALLITATNEDGAAPVATSSAAVLVI